MLANYTQMSPGLNMLTATYIPVNDRDVFCLRNIQVDTIKRNNTMFYTIVLC